MTELEQTVQVDGVSHPKWAFDQGRQAGLENKTTERNLMAFGLSFDTTELDARNTRGWLAGFGIGQKEREDAIASRSPGHDWSLPSEVTLPPAAPELNPTTARPEVIDPRVALRLNNLDRALFLAVLHLYVDVAGANLSANQVQQVAEQEFEDRVSALGRTSSTAEWRLGSKHSSQSKLKVATIFERKGDGQNPAIYFYFDPNAVSGVEDSAQIHTCNAFQTAVDDLLRRAHVAIVVKGTRSGPEIP